MLTTTNLSERLPAQPFLPVKTGVEIAAAPDSGDIVGALDAVDVVGPLLPRNNGKTIRAAKIKTVASKRRRQTWLTFGMVALGNWGIVLTGLPTGCLAE